MVVVEVARGRSPSAVLGNYSVTSSGGYHLWPSIHWLVIHLAELDLYLWVLPFAALIVLIANTATSTTIQAESAAAPAT